MDQLQYHSIRTSIVWISMYSHFIYLLTFFIVEKKFFFVGFHFHLLPFYAMRLEHTIKITLPKSGKYKLSFTDSGHKTILQTLKKKTTTKTATHLVHLRVRVCV